MVIPTDWKVENRTLILAELEGLAVGPFSFIDRLSGTPLTCFPAKGFHVAANCVEVEPCGIFSTYRVIVYE